MVAFPIKCNSCWISGKIPSMLNPTRNLGYFESCLHHATINGIYIDKWLINNGISIFETNFPNMIIRFGKFYNL